MILFNQVVLNEVNEFVVSGVADAVRCCKVDDSVLICENNNLKFFFLKLI